jgi:hypothetical protein
MRVRACFLVCSLLLAGCSADRANAPSAAYCQAMGQVTTVLQHLPQGSMTDHQATTTLAKAYLGLTGAAANDFGGQAQLNVTAFSDDVGRLKLAIDGAVGVDSAIAAIRQAIPALPTCAGSPSP